MSSAFNKKASALSKNIELNEKNSCTKRVNNRYKKIDIYGRQLNLTYKGSDTYKTSFGAFVSMFVLALIFAYGAYRSFRLFNRIGPEVSKKVFVRDLSTAEAFSPSGYGFDFAYGIRGEQALDPDIGHFTLTYIAYRYEESNGVRTRKKNKYY